MPRSAAPPGRHKRTARAAEPEGVERLHVRIAHSGICSRRAAEELIRQGRVTVNGSPTVEMGLKVGPEDTVCVDGVAVAEAKLYTLLVNKPVGVVTTLRDPQGRPTILRFLPDLGVQLKPVGRLDMDTEGLLLVTNDGDLAQRLAHPRHGVEKEYQVTVSGVPDEKALRALQTGVFLDDGKTAPAKVVMVHADVSRNTAVFRLTIHEGRKRQIRRMCQTLGHPVQALKRIRIGPFVLKGMRPGEARLLGKHELDNLRRSVGLE